MYNSFSTILIGSIFLLILNYFLIKNNIFIDRISFKEKHKKLLSLNNEVPLSGGLYFFPFIFILYYPDNYLFLIICGLFICLGFLSDLKIADSPKVRLLIQTVLLIIFLFFSKDIEIDTRIKFFNNLMKYDFLRILIISFFFLVLINGFNFIDGVNNLSSLNFLIILFFVFLLSKEFNNFYIQNISYTLILCLLIFVFFNFFGKNFLGDGGIYGFSFLVGFIIIKLSVFDEKISPYFLANLLWYPAFENLFSIIRRSLDKKKNYVADNYHLHQLIFKYFQNKKIFKRKYLISSFVGIIINCYLALFYYFGYIDYSDTKRQVYIIILNIIVYLYVYSKLKKLND